MYSITNITKAKGRFIASFIVLCALGMATKLFAQTNVSIPANNCQNCETPATLTAGAPSTVTTAIPACGNVTINGMYTAGTALTAANTVEIEVDAQATGPYTISTNTVNGYSFSASGNFTSTGVQSITLTGTGTPIQAGTDVFEVVYGSNSCTFSVNATGTGAFPAGTVHCSNPTVVQDVTTATGRVWMDRNLGAQRVAVSPDDAFGYGDRFQWGRLADGHQCIFSLETPTSVSTSTPGHSMFIQTPAGITPHDWLIPQNNNLWQGVNGVNNPCPEHYRIPTENEWQAEVDSWSSNNLAGAFSSALKLPAAGGRNPGASLGSGVYYTVSTEGLYWSSDYDFTAWLSSQTSRMLRFTDVLASMNSSSRGVRARGYTIRCIRCSQSAGAAAGDNASNCPFP